MDKDAKTGGSGFWWNNKKPLTTPDVLTREVESMAKHSVAKLFLQCLTLFNNLCPRFLSVRTFFLCWVPARKTTLLINSIYSVSISRLNRFDSF